MQNQKTIQKNIQKWRESNQVLHTLSDNYLTVSGKAFDQEIPPLEEVEHVVCKVCTISFERPVNYLCDAWHVFPPKYETWTHFNRP